LYDKLSFLVDKKVQQTIQHFGDIETWLSVLSLWKIWDSNSSEAKLWNTRNVHTSVYGSFEKRLYSPATLLDSKQIHTTTRKNTSVAIGSAKSDTFI